MTHLTFEMYNGNYPQLQCKTQKPWGYTGGNQMKFTSSGERVEVRNYVHKRRHNHPSAMGGRGGSKDYHLLKPHINSHTPKVTSGR